MKKLAALILIFFSLVALARAQRLWDWTPQDINRGSAFINGLIAWFPGVRHISGGNSWYDWINNNAALFTNGPIWGPPTCPGAEGEVRFSGSNYATAGLSPNTTDIRIKSIVVRVRPTAWPTSNGIGHIIEKRDPNGGWALNINNNGAGGNPTSGISFIQDYATSSSNWGVSSVITLGSCYTIGIAYDSNSPTGAPIIYVNGTSVTPTGISTAGSGAYISDATSNLELGGQPDGTRNYIGPILDARIYNRILSASEMKNLHIALSQSPLYSDHFIPQLDSVFIGVIGAPTAPAPLFRRPPHVY